MESQGAIPKYRFYSSYVMVAIDTHPTMFESAGQISPFKNTLKALYRLSDYLLLKSNKRGYSPFCVHLYDKDEKAAMINFKDNMIDTTKLLKRKCNLSEEEIKNEFMRDYDLDLAAFFQFCKRKFKDISGKFHKRILIFISNDPDPVLGDASKRFTALHEAKNFVENDITFQLIVTNEDFQYHVFYNEMFSLLDKSPLEIICIDEEGLYEKLISTICFRLSYRKFCFYPFADDFSKYITVYKKSYVKNERLLNNNFITVDGKIVKRISTKKLREPKPVTDRKYYLYYSNKKIPYRNVVFDINEKLECEGSRFPVGFTLMYVCRRLTGIGAVVNEPRIIEADFEEKLPFFNQFWQYCVNNDKVLVCAKVSKKRGQPKAVELIPKLIQGNKVFMENAIAHANEMYVPEKKNKNKNLSVPLTDDQKTVTETIIDKLTREFKSCHLIHGKYMRKAEYVKSKLLDEERKEVEVKDLLSKEEIDELLGDVLEDFKSCFPPPKGVKRKASKK